MSGSGISRTVSGVLDDGVLAPGDGHALSPAADRVPHIDRLDRALQPRRAVALSAGRGKQFADGLAVLLCLGFMTHDSHCVRFKLLKHLVPPPILQRPTSRRKP